MLNYGMGRPGFLSLFLEESTSARLFCRTRLRPRFAGGSHSRASVASLSLGDRLTDRETRTTRSVFSSFDRETRKDKSFTAVVLGSAQARRTRPRRGRRSL